MPLAEGIAKELVDHIPDFLYDDRPSLLSSSLVARTWVSTPRHHVCKRVTTHFFPGRGYPFKDSAHNFLAIFRSPHCTILPPVRDVVLNVDCAPAPDLLQELVDVLARAPLAKLHFTDHTTSCRDPISLSWMSPHFPGLREFSYNSLDRFVLDIFALVLIAALRQKGCSKKCHCAGQTISHSPGHCFRVVAPSNQFVAWLQTFGDRIRLEALNLEVFHFYRNGWGPITALNTFLGANGAHLQSFGLRIHYEDDGEVDESILLSQASDGDLELSGLTNLRSLSLGSHNVEAICTSLASLPSDSSSLEMLRVSFSTWIHYDEFPYMCDPPFLMDEFVSVVDGDQFAHLTAVTILGGREALRGYFPRWKDTESCASDWLINFCFRRWTRGWC
ncbi:hypothetical protein B0H12DRAFT_1306492 [Mycena haematopus]|nr:hypothetical protein B0H12DRAFT_1306492 [Mycena haematopus]